MVLWNDESIYIILEKIKIVLLKKQMVKLDLLITEQKFWNGYYTYCLIYW